MSDEKDYPPTTIEIVTGILEQAIAEVGGRATTYDSPQGEESMPKIVAMFNILYGEDITVEQGWQFMELVKQVRSSQGGYKRDNYVDQAAYAAFAGKAAQDASLESCMEDRPNELTAMAESIRNAMSRL